MKTFLKGLVIIFSLAAVSACQTNQAVYERPLIENQVLPSTTTEDSPSKPYPYTVASLMPQYRPELKSMEAGLWMSVEKAEKKTKIAGNRVTDKELNDYLHSIVCRLVEQYHQYVFGVHVY